MDKLTKIIFGLVIILTFTACSDFESQVVNEVNSDSEKYTDLIKTVENCHFSTDLYGKFISADKFPDSLKLALNKTRLKGKVNYIVIDKNNDCKGLSVEFILGNTHLEFNSCPDSGFPKAGSYKDEGFIETWGINRNWLIWKDNDFI